MIAVFEILRYIRSNSMDSPLPRHKKLLLTGTAKMYLGVSRLLEGSPLHGVITDSLRQLSTNGRREGRSLPCRVSFCFTSRLAGWPWKSKRGSTRTKPGQGPGGCDAGRDDM